MQTGCSESAVLEVRAALYPKLKVILEDQSRGVLRARLELREHAAQVRKRRLEPSHEALLAPLIVARVGLQWHAARSEAGADAPVGGYARHVLSSVDVVRVAHAKVR